MTIQMTLRCDVNKQNGRCCNDLGCAPAATSITQIYKQGKAVGWRFGKDNYAICPGCQ